MPENSWECQRALIPDARVVFDVGAHIGRTVARYLELYSRATVYAFEPAPANVKKFKERLPHLHGHERVRFFDCAVLDYDGKTTFNLYGEAGSHSVLKNSPEMAARKACPDWVRKSIKIRAIALDSFCAKKGIERIDILKLDAEGAEPRILNGARRLLEEKRIRLIYAEMIFDPLFEEQVYMWDLIPRFQEYGYKFHSLWHKGLKKRIAPVADAIFLGDDL